MENEEMMHGPDEEKNSFEGPSYEDEGANDDYGTDRPDVENDRDGWYQDPDATATGSPRVQKLLDELTDDGTGDDVPPDNPEGGKKGHDPERSQDAPGSRAKTAEEEEMELLQHVKSERGRERIKSIISARKEAEIQRSETQSEMDSFKDLITMTGLDRSDLAKTMEFGRLINKGDEKSLELALNMLENQRDAICKKLGREAPGVDLLSDLPELKSAVSRRELSMDHALKLAKYERQNRLDQQYRNEDLQRIQQSEAVLKELDTISASCDNFLKRYSGEADYEAKVERIVNYFSDPDTLNNFVRTVPPPMWFNHFKFLYENMSVPYQRSDYSPQPLRSRPMASGSVADTSNMTNRERIMKRMDDMGI